MDRAGCVRREKSELLRHEYTVSPGPDVPMRIPPGHIFTLAPAVRIRVSISRHYLDFYYSLVTECFRMIFQGADSCRNSVGSRCHPVFWTARGKDDADSPRPN